MILNSKELNLFRRHLFVLLSLIFLFGIIGCGTRRDYDGDGVKESKDKCPESPTGVQVDQNGCPVDTDADGVPDYLDNCPNTTSGAQIDSHGCKILLDSDGDGVPDDLDECPNEAGSIDNNGCIPIIDTTTYSTLGKETDTDNDGVFDEFDKCPNTPPGTRVNPDGCIQIDIGEDIPSRPPRTSPRMDGNKKMGEKEDGNNRGETPKRAEEATLSYSYKDTIKIPKPMELRIFVALNVDSVVFNKKIREKLNGKPSAGKNKSSDYIVNSVNMIGAENYVITFDYDPEVLSIDTVGKTMRNLSRTGKNYWSWKVYGKKEVDEAEITVVVHSLDSEGHKNYLDTEIINLAVHVEKAETLWSEYKYGVYGGIVAILLAGGIFWFLKRRKAAPLKKVYFSYAWGEEGNETIVDDLYNSLSDDGFDVVRDKVNLHYKGEISDFMHEIGEGKMIIVALSDKYLKSKFCIFELFEIYRNARMEKEKFISRIFPMRVEDIDLSDPMVVNSYVEYWKEEEGKLTANIEENGIESYSVEQANQLQIIRRVTTELGTILTYISDVNALDINAMKGNDFADIKSSLRDAMSEIDKKMMKR